MAFSQPETPQVVVAERRISQRVRNLRILLGLEDHPAGIVAQLAEYAR